MKKIIVIVVVLIIGGIYWYTNNSNNVGNLSDFENNKTSEIKDEDIIKIISDPQGKVLARGDINLDGYEDAIVEETVCSASCSTNLAIVFSSENNSLRLFTPTSPIDNFGPVYKASGATKSEVTNVVIKDGIIFLTGKGLSCSDACLEDEWNIISTVEYKFNNGELVQL